MAFKDFAAGLGKSAASGLLSGGLSSFFGGITAARDWKYRQKEMALQQKYNQENMQKQFEYQQQAWRAENEYNNPTKAAARWRLAGINPLSVFSSSPGGAGVAGSMGTPDSSNPAASSVGQGSNVDPMVLARMENEKRLADSQIALNKSLERKNNADAQGQENENSVFDGELVRRTREALAGKAEAEAEYQRIVNRFAPSLESGKVELQAADINKAIQELENLKQRYRLDGKQVEEIDANIDVLKSKKRNLDANTRNLDARTDTENATREERIKDLVSGRHLKDAQAALAAADQFFVHQKTEGQRIENELNRWITDQVVNRLPTEDWYTIAKEVVDRYLEYRKQNLDRDSRDKDRDQRSSDSNRSLILGIALRLLLSKV